MAYKDIIIVTSKYTPFLFSDCTNKNPKKYNYKMLPILININFIHNKYFNNQFLKLIYKLQQFYVFFFVLLCFKKDFFKWNLAM